MEDRIVTGEELQEDNDIVESSIRPLSIDEYIGQEKVKENLSIYIKKYIILFISYIHLFKLNN